MNPLDWTIITAVVGVVTAIGGGLVWLIDNRLESKLDKFSIMLAKELGELKQAIADGVKADMKEIREVVEDLDSDLTKLAADVAVLAQRIKALEEHVFTKRSR